MHAWQTTKNSTPIYPIDQDLIDNNLTIFAQKILDVDFSTLTENQQMIVKNKVVKFINNFVTGFEKEYKKLFPQATDYQVAEQAAIQLNQLLLN